MGPYIGDIVIISLVNCQRISRNSGSHASKQKQQRLYVALHLIYMSLAMEKNLINDSCSQLYEWIADQQTDAECTSYFIYFKPACNRNLDAWTAPKDQIRLISASRRMEEFFHCANDANEQRL